jgi:phospholipase/carboxylesterase
MDTTGFIHRFEKGRPEERPLLLLHGTGGDENDLIPLARMIAPTASLLSPRGKVLENGMPRFFRRLAEGVFDEDDVRRRANELADFLTNARARYDVASPIALGYSNGANVAAAVLLLRPSELAGAILLRAMPPLAHPQPVKLDGVPVLIVSGARRPRHTARVRCETGVIAKALWRRRGAANLARRARAVPSGRYGRAKLVE